jgi:hypothetical protein
LKKFLITAALIAMASPTYAITRNADGLPESTRTCRSLMHVEDDHDSAENHFAVGDVDTDGGSCVQYDNSPIANAILKKCLWEPTASSALGSLGWRDHSSRRSRPLS